MKTHRPEQGIDRYGCCVGCGVQLQYSDGSSADLCVCPDVETTDTTETPSTNAIDARFTHTGLKSGS
jgi:hypothetical protein